MVINLDGGAGGAWGINGKEVVDLEGWRKISESEVKMGALVGKLKEKVLSKGEMMRIAK